MMMNKLTYKSNILTGVFMIGFTGWNLFLNSIDVYYTVGLCFGYFVFPDILLLILDSDV